MGKKFGIDTVSESKPIQEGQRMAECQAVSTESGGHYCSNCDLYWCSYEEKPKRCKADLINLEIAQSSENVKAEIKEMAKFVHATVETGGKAAALTQTQRQTKADADMVYSIMQDMANTHRERSAVYGGNYRIVPKVVEALFPEGVPSSLVMSDQWHLFETILSKLTRFAFSNLTHIDSIHDISVYGSMIEMILRQKEESSEK